MEHVPPPRRMSNYVWFRVPGRIAELPAPFFLGHGRVTDGTYRTDRVPQDPLPDKVVLSIALTPGGQARVAGRVQSLKVGHAVFHEVHDEADWFGVHPQHRGGFEWVGFMMEGTQTRAMVAAIRQRYAGPYLLDPHAPLLRRLVGMAKDRSHSVTLSMAESTALVAEVIAAVLAAAEDEVHTPLTRRLAENAEALMSRQPVHDWTVAELAERCGVSREHLTRAFTQKYGVSPRRYLNELRIQKACVRLRGSDTPIKNIMMDLGYSSHATFTRAFRRYTKTTPSEYRQHKSP